VSPCHWLRDTCHFVIGFGNFFFCKKSQSQQKGDACPGVNVFFKTLTERSKTRSIKYLRDQKSI